MNLCEMIFETDEKHMKSIYFPEQHFILYSISDTNECDVRIPSKTNSPIKQRA